MNSSRLTLENLHEGDVIFLFKKHHNFHSHVGIVSRKKQRNTPYFLHATLTGVVYSPPYTSEYLQKLNCEQRVFRIEDADIRKRVLDIMETWAEYSIKFDNARVNRALQAAREELNVEWDYTKKIIPDFSLINDDLLQHAVQQDRNNFRIEDAIKYAVRRELIPIKPATNPENEHGLRCLLFFLSALQVAYIQDNVAAVNNQWCSLRHGIFMNPVTPYIVDKAKLTQLIPEEFRLSLKTCVPEIFARSIYNSKHMNPLGVLPAIADIATEDDGEQRVIDGLKKKEALVQRLQFRH